MNRALENQRRQVLVVDDDADVLRSMLRILQDDVEAVAALGAERALLVLESQHFDAVVCDFTMTAGPNGAWLLRQVRDRYPHIKRILLSGISQAELAPQLDPGLVDRFLEKPVEIDELIEAVTATVT